MIELMGQIDHCTRFYQLVFRIIALGFSPGYSRVTKNQLIASNEDSNMGYLIEFENLSNGTIRVKAVTQEELIK